MKICLVSFLLTGVAALSAPSASASGRTSAPHAFTITRVARGDNEQIVRGITQAAVLRLMSAPASKIAAHVWVYQNHPVASDRPEARDCDMLVLTFYKGRLADLKVVNRPAIGVISASLKPAPEAVRHARK